ncbi:putative iron-sulfur cluster assembly 1 like protein [Cricetulus griseus]|nr:putative iron-sulfur cluster assembly 1 like protein [Cricetulus griseus]
MAMLVSLAPRCAVSKRKLQPPGAVLTLTPSAVNKIKQRLKDKPEHVGLKVGVQTRGCNSLSYTLEYTKTKGGPDEEVIQDGVSVHRKESTVNTFRNRNGLCGRQTTQSPYCCMESAIDGAQKRPLQASEKT